MAASSIPPNETPRAERGAAWLVIVPWALLMLQAVALPLLLGAPGLEIILRTVRVALLGYALALNLLIWNGDGPAERPIARWCWSLGWFSFLVHLAAAFHFFHGWSHAHAFERTRAVSGVGEGIYVSYAFTIVWTVETFWWWLAPTQYLSRPRWVWAIVHGFMLFIVFNGTIIYAPNYFRWAGGIFFAQWIGLALWRGRMRMAAMQPIADGPISVSGPGQP